jgi:hypothetical protein
VNYGYAERYINYYDYISLPTSSYEVISNIQGDEDDTKKILFVEFNDRFFINALNKHIHKMDIEEVKEFTPYKGKANDIEDKISFFINDILNKELPPSDNLLFNTVSIKLNEVLEKQQSYIVHSTSLIHRLGKAYGLTLNAVTYHTAQKAYLLSYEIIGFVFEDKVYGDVLPSNLVTDPYQSLEDSMKQRIIHDKQYEKETLCKYIQDLKKFRNIDYTSLSEKNIDCDG